MSVESKRRNFDERPIFRVASVSAPTTPGLILIERDGALHKAALVDAAERVAVGDFVVDTGQSRYVLV